MMREFIFGRTNFNSILNILTKVYITLLSSKKSQHPILFQPRYTTGSSFQ